MTASRRSFIATALATASLAACAPQKSEVLPAAEAAELQSRLAAGVGAEMQQFGNLPPTEHMRLEFNGRKYDITLRTERWDLDGGGAQTCRTGEATLAPGQDVRYVTAPTRDNPAGAVTVTVCPPTPGDPA